MIKNTVDINTIVQVCRDTSVSLWNYICAGPTQRISLLIAVDTIVELAINKYVWKDILKVPPPAGVKLQFYTIGGTSLYGTKESFVPGFVTHWAYCLPSPSKQAGAIK